MASVKTAISLQKPLFEQAEAVATLKAKNLAQAFFA
jgi:hypothetical protein